MKNKQDLDFIRIQAKQIFDRVKGDWINYGRWTMPHRSRWMENKVEGERSNQIIVDTTHLLALRAFVAGFLEGNTSASRPWFRFGTGNRQVDLQPENHKWLDFFNQRTLRALNNSNFYHSAGLFYYDFGTFNTGAHYIEELPDNTLHWHVLTPGSYYVINDGYGSACVLVREFSMRVKSLVDAYGVKKENGKIDWSNFSGSVKQMYEDSRYEDFVDVAHVTMENEDFNPSEPVGGDNRQWISQTYESGINQGSHLSAVTQFRSENLGDENKYLKTSYSKRKPFIVGKSDSSTNFEYGEKGPTSDALGLIKSLNKKAIAKDRALEQMVNPAVQGPASLRKTYVTTAPNKFVPLDPTTLAKGGLKRIFEISPAIGALIQDTDDLRKMVDRHYYADFLLYLTKNPKTRTATETSAILEEQQRVIGPNLQSLNWTYNSPVVEFVADYVLDNDPEIPPIPEGLQGRSLRPEFISVFAQAQRAADLPAINQYVQMVQGVGQLNPRINDKLNLDILADLYEDRLYLPEGLNRGQEETDRLREQAQAQLRKQQQMEALVQQSQAAKNVGLKVNDNNQQGEQ